MRKVDDGKKKKKEKKEKIMLFLVATNVVASRPPTDWNAACSCQNIISSLTKSCLNSIIHKHIDTNKDDNILDAEYVRLCH